MADTALTLRATGALERLKKGEMLSPEDAEAIRAVTGKSVPPDKITGTVEALKTAYDRAGAELRDVSATARGKAAIDKAQAKLEEARKAMMTKAEDEYTRGSVAPDRVEYLGKILGYAPADIAKRAGKEPPKAPAPFTTPPASRLTPAGAFMPPPVAGGAPPASPIAPVAPATPAPPTIPATGGAILQPAIAAAPSKAGPSQGEPGAMPAPPPPMGEAAPGGQPKGESAPEARAFWDYLQKMQSKGELVSDRPMYTKAFDDATPDEKARLIKENRDYFEKF